MWCVTTGVATRARLCDHPFRMPRRLRPLLIVVFLLAASCMLVACRKEDTQESVSPAGTVAFGKYSDDGSSFTVVLTGVHPTGNCITSIIYQWDASADYTKDNNPRAVTFAVNANPRCSNPTDIAASVTTTVTIPTRTGGGTLYFRFKKYVEKETTQVAWTDVTVPAYTPAPAPARPSVVVFAHASPAGDGGTLLDARLSTGTGALSYAWSPTSCSEATYHGVAVPAGTTHMPDDYSGTTCSVEVSSSNGTNSSANVTIRRAAQMENGSFGFAGSSATITGAYVYGGLSPYAARTACVDLDGTGVYSLSVALTGGGAGVGTFPLTSLGVGTHRISATLWSEASRDCTSTSETGYMQTISDLYTVDSAGAVRRGLRSSSFIAPSSMRFGPTKTLSEGTFNPETGVISGATMVGSFSWTTPKSSKGVKRPSGAAQLTKGTFVMRAINEMQGPSVGKASIMLGTGTMLLRGTDGTLACGTLAGSFNSSAITLAGGTGRARTLAGVLTSERVTYVWPTPASVAARSGGVAGVLATALGWITGDQPTERAKKPSKKPKWPKVRPVKGSGTASLQTAAKAAGLPASCKALVQYLPQ